MRPLPPARRSWASRPTSMTWPGAGCCRRRAWPGPGKIPACPPPSAAATWPWPATWGRGSALSWSTRLVDPAARPGSTPGRSEELSFEATLPALAEESQRHASLTEAAARCIAASPPAPGASSARRRRPPSSPRSPAGWAPASGRRRRLGGGGADRRDGPRASRAHPGGWRLTVDPPTPRTAWTPDAVVLAVPAQPAARLLARAAGRRATRGRRWPGSPTRAWRSSPWPTRPRASRGRLEGSGYLVPSRGRPPGEGGHLLLRQVAAPAFRRCGHGRGPLLAGAGGGGAAAAAGRRRPGRAWPPPTWPRRPGCSGEPADVRVTRWGGALPQYTVGHLGRVAADPRGRWAASPAWPCAGPPTTGSGSRPASPPPAARPQVLRYLREAMPA